MKSSAAARSSASGSDNTHRKRQRFVLFRPLPWLLGFVPMLLVGVVFAVRSATELRIVVDGALFSIEGKHGISLGWIHGLLGSDMRHDGASLFTAIERNDLISVAYLLESGIDPNVFDAEGRTPLSASLEKKSPMITEKLLSRGASPGTKDGSGMPPLVQAVRTDSAESVAWLLRAKAPVNEVDGAGMTPLMHASYLGNPTILALLLAAQPEVDRTDNAGRTALHHALRTGQEGAAKLLLVHGADPDVEDRTGARPRALISPGSPLYPLLPGAAAIVESEPEPSEDRGELEIASADINSLGATAAAEDSGQIAAKRAQTPDDTNGVAALRGDDASPPDDEAAGASENDSDKEAAASETDDSKPEATSALHNTRLRVLKQPVGVFVHNRGLALSQVSVEVRNAGSYEATNVAVEVELPGGTKVPLRGPATLKANETAEYSARPNATVHRQGKLKATAHCDNCWR